MLVVGGKEAEAGTVAVRRHGAGDQGAQPLDEFVGQVKEEIRTRAIAPEPAEA
jgi:threonyl-tRNA synthetase